VNCAEDINFDLESKGAATARAALDGWLAGSHGRAPEDGWRRAPSPERGSDVVCRADNWEVTVGHPPAGGFVVYATACSTHLRCPEGGIHALSSSFGGETDP
jgi:hypothetical protein